MTDDTATVLLAFEERLALPALALQSMDRLELPQAITSQRSYRGVHVEVPTTTNTDQYRDIDLARVDENVIVTLFFRLGPKDQKQGRTDALRLEKRIRETLVDTSWRPEWHVRFRTTSRGPDPASAEVYRITQTFLITRDDSLGG